MVASPGSGLWVLQASGCLRPPPGHEPMELPVPWLCARGDRSSTGLWPSSLPSCVPWRCALRRDPPASPMSPATPQGR